MGYRDEDEPPTEPERASYPIVVWSELPAYVPESGPLACLFFRPEGRLRPIGLCLRDERLSIPAALVVTDLRVGNVAILVQPIPLCAFPTLRALVLEPPEPHGWRRLGMRRVFGWIDCPTVLPSQAVAVTLERASMPQAFALGLVAWECA